MQEKFITIGTIYKPSGTQGELKTDIMDVFFEDFLKSDHIFIKLNGLFVPYFIEEIRETNQLLLKIEEIDNPESASILCNKDIYLRQNSIRPEALSKLNEREQFEGYTIYDSENLIGSIESIEYMPQQIIAWVNYHSKLIAIPLAEGLIHETDHKSKTFYMNLPQGILDL